MRRLAPVFFSLLALGLWQAAPASAQVICQGTTCPPEVFQVPLQGGAGSVLIAPTDLVLLGLVPVDLTLVVATEDGPLSLEGTVEQGSYDSAGGISFSGALDLAESFTYQRSGTTTTLSSGSVQVEVVASELIEVTLAVSITVETDVESDVASSLKVEGSIQGTYQPGTGIDLDGTLTLVPPFQYKKGRLTVDFQSGDIDVVVTASELQSATFAGIVVDASLDLGGGPEPLKLDATLDDGSYTPSDGVEFAGRLEVTEDFVYEKDPVVATLKQGGSVDVTVEQSEFERADFDVEVDVDVSIEGEDAPLLLEGSLEGRYESSTFDVSAELTVRQPFTYTRDPVTATLSSSAATAGVRTRTLRPGRDALDFSLVAVPDTDEVEVDAEEQPPGNSGGNGNGNSASPANQGLQPFSFHCTRDSAGLLTCTKD